MKALQVGEVLAAEDLAFAMAITGLVLVETADGPVVQAVDRTGVTTLSVGVGGQLAVEGAVSHGGPVLVGSEPDAVVADGRLFLSGLPLDAGSVALDSDGAILSVEPVAGPVSPARALASFEQGGAAWLFWAGVDGELGVFAVDGTGTLTPVGPGLSEGNAGAISDLTVIEVGAGAVVLTADGERAALSSHSLAGDGTMTPVAEISAAAGVGLSDPGSVVGVEVAGRAYAVVGSAGSGALTVSEVYETGDQRLADHVLDTRETRFGGAASVEATEAGDFAFVAAAGSDDGVSLFTLLPDGRLVHLSSFADAPDTLLENVGALSLYTVDGALQVLAASGSAAGLTRLTYDISGLGVVLSAGDTGAVLIGTAGDDILAGAEGADDLSGGSGSDILADGGGIDVLTGGAGADLFVLSGDGALDRITDFEVGDDQLDLSDWRFFYGADQLAVAPTATGAIVTYRDETLEIVGADLAPISAEEIAASLAVTADRPPLVPVGQTLTGTGADDILIGSVGSDDLSSGGGSDTLRGGEGDDSLDGGTGEDSLWGGVGADVLSGGAGFDFLHGEGGDDQIFGGAQADTAFGGAGDDEIRGGDGLDTAYGEDGADRIWGDAGNDRLWGGAGNDQIRGGTQEDHLIGEEGADQLWGEAGFDHLDGGAGDDHLDGGAQADNLYGRAGDDVMLGGDGFDRLFGGPGNDVMDGGASGDGMYGEDGDDTLLGGSGDDRLNGGPGDDWIDGGGGDDSLRGGSGFDTLLAGPGNDVLQGDFNADTFVFADGFGIDRIVDFAATNDFERIDVSGVTAIDDWADLIAHHMVQDGPDVRITAGADVIVLEGVSLADLDPVDFVF